MTNPQKTKGDRGEREAVLALTRLAGDRVVENPRRKLGAGRRDDMGDLDVLPGVTIQVKTMSDLSRALRSAASGAMEQRERSGDDWALGMAPVPHARSKAVRWLAATEEWPGGEPDADCVAGFGMIAAAISHARREDIGVPRYRRLAVVRRLGQPALYVAPLEAWVHDWCASSSPPHCEGSRAALPKELADAWRT